MRKLNLQGNNTKFFSRLTRLYILEHAYVNNRQSYKNSNRREQQLLEFLTKWGCDSFKQTQLKKKFYNSTESDASIYKYVKNSRVPCDRQQILLTNEKQYCRSQYLLPQVIVSQCKYVLFMKQKNNKRRY